MLSEKSMLSGKCMLFEKSTLSRKCKLSEKSTLSRKGMLSEKSTLSGKCMLSEKSTPSRKCSLSRKLYEFQEMYKYFWSNPNPNPSRVFSHSHLGTNPATKFQLDAQAPLCLSRPEQFSCLWVPVLFRPNMHFLPKFYNMVPVIFNF